VRLIREISLVNLKLLGFLRKKLLDGKRIPWWEISKEILFTTSSERMVYYLRYATRMKGVVLKVLLLQQVRF
jgi:hypothetical protein